MGNNNTVFLLVGQRGAGKSIYAEKLAKAYPTVGVVSRDEILMRRFGSVSFDNYSGHGVLEYVQGVIFRLLRMKLRNSSGVQLILDHWTFTGEERKTIIHKLHNCVASKVVALYFVTPVEAVNEWFWKKPKIAKMNQMNTLRGLGFTFFSENAPANDHRVFHSFADGVDSDGFDEVIRVNPLETITPEIELAFNSLQ